MPPASSAIMAVSRPVWPRETKKVGMHGPNQAGAGGKVTAYKSFRTAGPGCACVSLLSLFFHLDGLCGRAPRLDVRERGSPRQLTLGAVVVTSKDAPDPIPEHLCQRIVSGACSMMMQAPLHVRSRHSCAACPLLTDSRSQIADAQNADLAYPMTSDTTEPAAYAVVRGHGNWDCVRRTAGFTGATVPHPGDRHRA